MEISVQQDPSPAGQSVHIRTEASIYQIGISLRSKIIPAELLQSYLTGKISLFTEVAEQCKPNYSQLGQKSATE